MEATAQTSGSLPVRATELHYATTGAGVPILLVGGPQLGYAYLRPHMDVLGDSFHLVYCDFRGSGRSPVGDPGLLSLDGHISDLVEVIEGLKLDRPVLLGHSLGADVAALFAARHPRMIRALVLANPAPPFAPEQQTLLGQEMGRRQTPETKAALKHLSGMKEFSERQPAAMEAFFRTVYLPFFNDPRSAARVSLAFTGITADNVRGAEERTLKGLDASGAMAELKAITCPTLVLWGEHEPVPEAFPRELAHSIAGARFVAIAGGSHFAYVEDPTSFFAPIRDFLTRV
jgi:proline iminopeptidase